MRRLKRAAWFIQVLLPNLLLVVAVGVLRTRPENSQLLTALGETNAVMAAAVNSIFLLVAGYFLFFVGNTQHRVRFLQDPRRRFLVGLIIALPSLIYVSLLPRVFSGGGFGIFASVVLLILIAGWFIWVFQRSLWNRLPANRLLGVRIGATGTALLLCLLGWVGMYLLATANPIGIGRWLGVVLISGVFVTLLLATIAAIMRLGRVGGLLIALSLIPLLGWNDGHHMTVRDHIGEAGIDEMASRERRSDVHDSLYRWLLTRNDLFRYVESDRAYPVFILMSSGGGGYAAAHAYTFQVKAQQLCPMFTQHLYAAVGISGGAVGNFLASYANQEYVNPPVIEENCNRSLPTDDIVDDALHQDMLSPLALKLFFSDFLNRVFFGKLSQTSRVDTFRELLVVASGSPEAATAGIFDHFWDTDDEGGILVSGRTAQFPIATDVATGFDFAMGPFPLWGEWSGKTVAATPPTLSALRALNNDPGVADVSLIDAVLASAAFPYVTPALQLTLPDYFGDEGRARQYKLVDGGYFDGSGLTTAFKILADYAPYFTPVSRDDVERLFQARVDRGEAMPGSYQAGMARLLECEQVRFLFVNGSGGGTPDIGSSLFDGARQDFINKVYPRDDCTMRFTLHFISLSSTDTSRPLEELSLREMNWGPDEAPPTLQRFFLDPIFAIMNARQARVGNGRERFLQIFCPACDADFVDSFLRDGYLLQHFYDVQDLQIPLGWDMPEGRLRGANANVLPDEPVREREGLIAGCEARRFPESERRALEEQDRQGGKICRNFSALVDDVENLNSFVRSSLIGTLEHGRIGMPIWLDTSQN